MTAAALERHTGDSTPDQPAVYFAAAHFFFRQLDNWLNSDEANHLGEADVETQLRCRGRELLRLLLQAHLAQRGTGQVGHALRVFDPKAPTQGPDAPAQGPEAPAQAEPPPQPACARHAHKRLHERTLHTTLGAVCVWRTAYAADGRDSVHPLDQQLQLPARCFSHPLQEGLLRHAVQGPFGEAVGHVTRATGIALSKRSAEQLACEAACDFQAFYRQQPAAAGEVGPIVVTGIDCKGVPMIKPEKTLRKPRRGKGDKKHKKRMATVASVRTARPRVRTPEEVVDSLFAVTPKDKEPRVRTKPSAAAEHKRVWADLLASKDEVIAEVVEEVQRVDPTGSKTHVALCDGERALKQRILPALRKVAAGAVLILDLMHALERLWKVGHCFYEEGSDEATAWVREQALRVLRGEVGGVIAGMQGSADEVGLQGSRREVVDKACRYLQRNREYMRYDEYLRRGLPIASGCVEGACRHLIKDRLERSGMRWSLAGAQAMLRLRSLYVSGDFDEYWDFHLEQEQRRLHPPGRWEVVEE